MRDCCGGDNQCYRLECDCNPPTAEQLSELVTAADKFLRCDNSKHWQRLDAALEAWRAFFK